MQDTYMIVLLLVLIVIPFEIIHTSDIDECFYYPGHLGKKCFNSDNSGYSCCLFEDICRNGVCYPRSSNPPSHQISFEMAVLIGVGVSTVTLTLVIVIAIYTHRRYMNSKHMSLNGLAFFSQSINNTSPSKGSSAGVRIHASSSKSPSDETNDNLELITFDKV